MRMSALWGKGRRGGAVALVAVLVLALGAPGAFGGSSGSSGGSTGQPFITSSLYNAANANQSAAFNVIVKGAKGISTSTVTSDVKSDIGANPGTAKGIKRQFSKVLNGNSAQLTGKQILGLLHNPHIGSITVDGPVVKQGLFTNNQLWPSATRLSSFWNGSVSAPAIAVVDSGVDATRVADFGGRVVAQQSFVSTGATNSAGDSFGHGTFVASIAAGQAAGFAGAAPTANIVSLDVFDDSGAGVTSDVIAALDWIYQNKGTYNIRVVNLSLTGSQNSSFMYDPLDQAVEKLWFSGVVVVTAAGNYASNGQASGVPYAPENDPFVITVGASDINNTIGSSDDFAAPWSAYGYTLDGFAKPEIGAPGRYMNGAVPMTSTMYTQHPERAVVPGYMWMSGTSFAAAAVSGAVADILSENPNWTPDQVKGALMLAADPYSGSGSHALGVGVVDAAQAAAVKNPPNPNAGLDNYVVSDSNGGQMFDSASWSSAAQSSASWSSASWSSASWSSASWSSASWSSASWSSASWSSASWSSGATRDGSLPSASWTSLSWLK
jgi:serine protease AprX